MTANTVISADISPLSWSWVKIRVGNGCIPWAGVVVIYTIRYIVVPTFANFRRAISEASEQYHQETPPNARAYEVVHDNPSFRSPPALYLTSHNDKKQAM